MQTKIAVNVKEKMKIFLQVTLKKSFKMEPNSRESAKTESLSKDNCIFRMDSFMMGNFFWTNFMERGNLPFQKAKRFRLTGSRAKF